MAEGEHEYKFLVDGEMLENKNQVTTPYALKHEHTNKHSEYQYQIYLPEAKVAFQCLLIMPVDDKPVWLHLTQNNDLNNDLYHKTMVIFTCSFLELEEISQTCFDWELISTLS